MDDNSDMSIRSLLLPILLFLSLLACSNGTDGSYQGYMEGEYLYVSSPVGGTVANVPAVKGTRVSPGTLLYELDPEPEEAAYQEASSLLMSLEAQYKDKTRGLRPSELAEIEAAIKKAEAALDLSRKEFRRNKRLYEQEIIAEDKLDYSRSVYESDLAAVDELNKRLATARLGARAGIVEAARKDAERARASLDAARWALENKKGFSPAEALVYDVLYKEGEFVPPGRPVVVLLPDYGLKARFFVPEAVLSSLQTGQRANVLIDGRASALEGTISYISPEAEYTPPFIYSKDSKAKLVFLVEVAFAPEAAASLHPGQPVEVRVLP